MSTLDPEVVTKQMPQQIEDVRAAHLVKLKQAGEFYEDMAKQTGAADFINAAKKLNEIIEKVCDYVKGLIGEEGDTAGDQGTLYGLVAACQKLINATGGAV